jgi:Trypsin
MARFVAAVAACTAMLAVPASSQAIVNGSPDAGAHSNVGALTEHFNGAQVLACTGTLISPTVLVTAAHCTAKIEQFGFKQTEVSFDTNIGSGSDITCGAETADCYVQPAPNSLHVGTLHTNPLFNGSTTTVDSHDVAVVTFDKPIKGITPASLPTAGLLDSMANNGTFASQTFTNVGYGWHAVVSVSQSTGLLDGVRRYATSGSQSLSTSDLKLSENATLGFGGACSHDSGGPAFVGNGGVVAGEVSALQGNCDATYYVYRLDTASARSFLANYVALP